MASRASGAEPLEEAGVTVLGNLAVDVVDDADPSPGGCPSFAAHTLARLGRPGRIVTRAARADLPLFDAVVAGMQVPCDLLPSDRTSSFGLRYSGEQRELTVERIGPTWTPEDLRRADVRTRWVHVSPLLRSDFPADALAVLHNRGHLVSYDGQGLVRAPQLGPLVVDRDFDPRVLQHLQVLKLADDESQVLTGGAFGAADAVATGVPEVLVTHGSGGCDLYVEGRLTHVSAPWQVRGVHSTGSGDMFSVAYVAGRAAGADPVEAAAQAALFVAGQLDERLRASGSRTP